MKYFLLQIYFISMAIEFLSWIDDLETSKYRDLDFYYWLIRYFFPFLEALLVLAKTRRRLLEHDFKND